MDLSSVVFADSAPWPDVTVTERNSRYAAAMLSNIGSCSSEMSTISLYVYNNLITRKLFPEISQCFHKISIVEMRHLEAFGELSILLGADPRLWSPINNRMRYWSPACNRYPVQIGPLIANALAGEEEAVRKYQSQANWIRDCRIQAVLNRIIADEQCHIKLFRLILSELNSAPCARTANAQALPEKEADPKAPD